MIGGTRQIVVEDNQRARIKTTGFLQIKVSQKGLGKSRTHESNNRKVLYFNPTLINFAELCIDNW